MALFLLYSSIPSILIHRGHSIWTKGTTTCLLTKHVISRFNLLLSVFDEAYGKVQRGNGSRAFGKFFTMCSLIEQPCNPEKACFVDEPVGIECEIQSGFFQCRGQ